MFRKDVTAWVDCAKDTFFIVALPVRDEFSLADLYDSSYQFATIKEIFHATCNIF